MGKLKFLLVLAAVLFGAGQVRAQEVEEQEADIQEIEERDDVWRRNVRYNNIGYEIHKISTGADTFKANYGISFSKGRTYYLHKKPIAGLMKFGLDWTILDLAGARFGDDVQLCSVKDKADGGLLDIDYGDNVYKLDVGMGFGPSFTVNPVDYLKTGVYFHVTPSYSLFLQDVGLMGKYFTYFNLGLNVSYKVISLGVEYRWCGDGQYKLFSPEKVAEKVAGKMTGKLDGTPAEGLVDEEDIVGSSPEVTCPTLSASAIRFYLSFRFGKAKR